MANGGMMVHDGFQRIRFYGHSARLIKKQLLKSSQNKKFEAPIVFSTFCYSEVSHCHTATVLKLEVSHCVTNTTITSYMKWSK